VVISSAPLSRVNHLSSTNHSPLENILEATCNYKNSASSLKRPHDDDLNEVDLSVDDEDFIFAPDKDTSGNSDRDIGAWTLIPKDHLLICKGDVDHPNQVSSISLQPVRITNPFHCEKTMALFRKRTKEKLLVCKSNGSIRSGSSFPSTKLRSKL